MVVIGTFSVDDPLENWEMRGNSGKCREMWGRIQPTLTSMPRYEPQGSDKTRRRSGVC
jgi:hypothetical protein